jgi:hypothetical protein
MTKGWRREPLRHSLARKGVRTGRKNRSGKNSVQTIRPHQITVPEDLRSDLNMGEIIQISKDKGSHWFDEDSMRFFNSNIDFLVYKSDVGKYYFVTSEKYTGQFGGKSQPRRWSVRRFDKETGNVTTVGEFQKYRSLKEARQDAIILARLNQ